MKQITFQQLKGQLFIFNTWNDDRAVQYEITENFQRVGERSYTVHNLDILEENNNWGNFIVATHDNEEITYDPSYVLNMFQPKLVQDLYDKIIDDTYIAHIQFADGYIEIKTDISDIFER
jgi:hypothetical protein